MALVYPGQIVRHEMNISSPTSRVESCPDKKKNPVINGKAGDSGLGDVDLNGEPPS